MSMLWSDIDAIGNPIYFTSLIEHVCAALLAVIASTGFCLTVFIIVLILKNNLVNSPNYLHILSMAIAGAALAASTSIITWVNVSKGGWAVGKWACLLQNQFIFTTEFITLFSLLAATIDLYRIIILQMYTSIRTTKLFILSIWLFGILFGCWGYFIAPAERIYQNSLSPSHLVCMLTWWTDSRHKNAFAAVVVCIFVMIAVMCIMIFCYFKICRFYYLSLRKRHVVSRSGSVEGNAEDHHKPKRNSTPLTSGEKKLLMRSLVICGSNVVFTTPYLVMILCEFVSKTPASSETDAFATLVFSLYYVCVAIWILVFDNQIKAAVRELLFRNDDGVKSKNGQSKRLEKKSGQAPVENVTSLARNWLDLDLEKGGLEVVGSRSALFAKSSSLYAIESPKLVYIPPQNSSIFVSSRLCDDEEADFGLILQQKLDGLSLSASTFN